MGHFQSRLIQCLNNVARDPDVICLFVAATCNSAILPGLGLSTWADFPHGTKMAAAVPGGTEKRNAPALCPFLSEGNLRSYGLEWHHMPMADESLSKGNKITVISLDQWRFTSWGWGRPIPKNSCAGEEWTNQQESSGGRRMAIRSAANNPPQQDISVSRSGFCAISTRL